MTRSNALRLPSAPAMYDAPAASRGTVRALGSFSLVRPTAWVRRTLVRAEIAYIALMLALAGLLWESGAFWVQSGLIMVVGALGMLMLLSLHRREQASRRALTAAYAAQEAAGQARGEFLAMMSHEIRTPINGVVGVAGLMLDMELGADEKRYVRLIIDSGTHLLGVVNDILDFSRMESGRMTLDETAFDVRGVVRSAIDLLAAEAREKGLELVADIAEDVPRRAGGDARRLRQVLLNLIGNAIKFTEAGSVRIGVRRMAEEAEVTRLEFTVADTGIGIAPEAIGRLFDAFTQEDSSASRRFGGSGLGLAISRRLVEAMGGKIALASTRGRGSVFRFDVLLKARRLSDDAPKTRRVHGPEGHPAPAPLPAGRRLLVAEDNATNLLVVTRLLERLGHHADTVTDGREAVEAVARAEPPYDLVMMDVMMPGMDGRRATELIRSLPGSAGQTPIIGLTAHTRPEELASCLAAGMNQFIGKPVSSAQLAQAIEQLGLPQPSSPRPLVENRSFDPAVLDAIVQNIGVAAATELVRAFIAQGTRDMATLPALAQQGKLVDLMRQAHGLARRAGDVGLMRLARAGATLENEAAAGHEEEVAAQMRELGGLLHAGMEELSRWRAAET